MRYRFDMIAPNAKTDNPAINNQNNDLIITFKTLFHHSWSFLLFCVGDVVGDNVGIGDGFTVMGVVVGLGELFVGIRVGATVGDDEIVVTLYEGVEVGTKEAEEIVSLVLAFLFPIGLVFQRSNRLITAFPIFLLSTMEIAKVVVKERNERKIACRREYIFW